MASRQETICVDIMSVRSPKPHGADVLIRELVGGLFFYGSLVDLAHL